jgi:hypothetical protein
MITCCCWEEEVPSLLLLKPLAAPAPASHPRGEEPWQPNGSGVGRSEGREPSCVGRRGSVVAPSSNASASLAPVAAAAVAAAAAAAALGRLPEPVGAARLC